MTFWINVKKRLQGGLQSATDKTSEYTKIGRIKIDILAIKKEIEEKLVELGGRLYHLVSQEQNYEIAKDKYILQLIEQIKELEAELEIYDKELQRIKSAEGIDLD